MIWRTRGSRAVVLLASLSLLAPGCDGEVGDADDAGAGGDGTWLPDCAASRQSGLWLLPFGSTAPEVGTGATQTLTVMLNRGSSKQGEGRPVAGRKIAFRIITQTGDASLDVSDSTTNQDGLASVKLQAGKQEGVVQVEASTDGTCPVTFSVDVKKPLVQLRIVTPSTDPFDTFTGSRVPVAAQASTCTTMGGGPVCSGISGAKVTFALQTGKTAETLLGEVSGGTGSQTLQLAANSNGLATAMLDTGSAPIPSLKVVASMSGTADASVTLRISNGTGGTCKTDTDCPLGYTCNGGKCQPPVVTPSSGCKSDADCQPPLKCQVSTGKCLQGTGQSCDPIEGLGCAPDEVCVGRECAKLPKTCTDNSQCPGGFVCVSGQCVPQGKPSTGGCVTNANCPTGQVCVNGVCQANSACQTPHNPDRLKGTWKYDSMLHLREALQPWLKGLLGTSSVLNSIFKGTFSIPGIPSFLSSLVSTWTKNLAGQYVPPWGQQLVSALSDINDVCSDMRVLSTMQKTPAGTDHYACSEQWDLVEFKYQGMKVSSPPSAIPTIGQVKVNGFTATEVCGVLHISKHTINNKVGGIIKWAIDTTLSLITCSVQGLPCYNSVTQALQMSIDCQGWAKNLDQVIQSLWSGAPSVSAAVALACEGQKKSVIDTINKELNDLATKLSLLEMSGTATIPVPGLDTVLQNGVWSGVLGDGITKGNYKGEFTAKRGP